MGILRGRGIYLYLIGRAVLRFKEEGIRMGLIQKLPLFTERFPEAKSFSPPQTLSSTGQRNQVSGRCHSGLPAARLR